MIYVYIVNGFPQSVLFALVLPLTEMSSAVSQWQSQHWHMLVSGKGKLPDPSHSITNRATNNHSLI